MNDCFFAASNLDFEAISKSSDLTGISKPSAQGVKDLSEADVIEFVDSYGKKGLIKVAKIYLGARGNGYDSDAYIEINIKVQP